VSPVKAPAGNVGYSRFGPYHKDRTARVTDDPIGDPAGENPPYPSTAPTPHDPQADSELLGELALKGAIRVVQDGGDGD
jgi:hypothetical protein